MLKKKKNPGFTLIESLVAIGILGSASALLIKEQTDETNKLNTKNFVKDISTIMNAVDHRILIDGYNATLWTDLTWVNETEIVSKLLAKELISTESACLGGEWNTTLESDEKIDLINCGLWSPRKGLNVDMKAKFTVDGLGFIERFDFVFNFKEEDQFKNNFINLKHSLRSVFENNKRELSGKHKYTFVNKNNETVELTPKECIASPLNCSVMATFTRGTGEYVRTDGSNSIINDKLTFIETAGNSPLSCVKWSESSGSWSSSVVDCGVGLYDKSNTAVLVDVVAETGSFEAVMLNESCKVHEWDGTKVVDSGDITPCGMKKDSGDIYQVVEKTIGTNAVFNELYLTEGFIDLATLEKIEAETFSYHEIKSPYIEAETVNVSKAFISDLSSINLEKVFFNDGTAVFNGEVNMSDLNILNNPIFVEGINVSGNINNSNQLEVKEKITVNKKTTIENNTNLNNLNASGNINIGNDIEIKEAAFFDENIIIENKLTSNTTKAINSSSKKVSVNTVNVGNDSVSSVSMSAPIGDFDNINADLDWINHELVKLVNSSNNLTSPQPPSPPPPPEPPKTYKWVSAPEITPCMSNAPSNKVYLGDSCSNPGSVGYTSKARNCSSGHTYYWNMARCQ